MGEEEQGMQISPPLCPALTQTQILEMGGKGTEEEDNLIDRKLCEKVVFHHNLKLSRETTGDKLVILCGLL